MKNVLLGFLGIFLLILGLILSFNIFKHYLLFFLLGWLFLVIFINEQYFSKSNLKILINKKFILLLILFGGIITLIIEYVGAYLSPAWVYSFNFFNFKFDFWFSIGAYILLIPVAYETFTLIKNLTKIRFKKALNFKKSITPLLILSLILLVLPFIWSSEKYPGLPFCFFIIGLFLFLDFINYKTNKNSVITNSLNDPKYFLILIITSLAMAILIECTNLPQYVWTYINIPFLSLTLFKVPLVILIGWIPLVGLWINLFEIITRLSYRSANNSSRKSNAHQSSL